MSTEAAVRRRLCDEVLSGAAESREPVFEFWVPRSYERADVVTIGTHMSGFEIKTERDTLNRLPRQASAYGRLFDRCTVVLAERHVPAALDMLPEWWGVIAIATYDTPPSFRTLRSVKLNGSVDAETLVRLLWREEVRAVLSVLGDQPDPRASRSSMWQQLLTLVDLPRLKEIVREALLGRDPNVARRFCAADASG